MLFYSTLITASRKTKYYYKCGSRKINTWWQLSHQRYACQHGTDKVPAMVGAADSLPFGN
jgi:hypothetical protein